MPYNGELLPITEQQRLVPQIILNGQSVNVLVCICWWLIYNALLLSNHVYATKFWQLVLGGGQMEGKEGKRCMQNNNSTPWLTELYWEYTEDKTVGFLVYLGSVRVML